MKIEKLTENKIRVIINDKDLNESHTDIKSIMTKSLESQGLFLDILKRAEKEVGFYTDGCKLLIEAFSSIDEFLVFTITKSKKSETSAKNLCKTANNKKLSVKRKTFSISNKQVFFSFDTFEQFCEFCAYIHNFKDFEIKKVSKNISLYLYNSVYYLMMENINTDYIYLKRFYFALSEFGDFTSFSPNFKNKLVEHGNVIFKKHAITKAISFFVN